MVKVGISHQGLHLISYESSSHDRTDSFDNRRSQLASGRTLYVGYWRDFWRSGRIPLAARVYSGWSFRHSVYGHA